MPAAEQVVGRFAFAVRNKGKLKAFVWVWMERVTPKKPRVPERHAERPQQHHAVGIRPLQIVDPEQQRTRACDTFEQAPKPKVALTANASGVRLDLGPVRIDSNAQKGTGGSLHLDGHELGLHVKLEGAATLGAVDAEILGQEGRLGVIAPGAFADLLAVDGNPLEDLHLLQDDGRHLALIVKDGVVVKNNLSS